VRSFVELVERTQLRSEGGGWPGKGPEELLRLHEARARFFSALENSSASDADVAALAGDETSRTLSPEQVRSLRNTLANCPVSFTTAESPFTCVTLAASFARTWRFIRRQKPRAEFLLATDCTYRPHASVQEWSEDRYLILMSRSLIWDLSILADVVAMHIGGVRAALGDSPWRDPAFPYALLMEFEHSELRWQIPYLLCGFVEGERYRFATQIGDGAFEQAVGAEIAAGAIDCLLGHELAHVHEGHVRSKPQHSELWGPARYAATHGHQHLGAEASRRVDDYSAHFWPHHERELVADRIGLAIAGSSGPEGAWDLRLMGAQLALGLISFLDRATYMVQQREDPAMLLGLEQYNIPGLVDLLLPKKTHPWGKTRATSLNNSLADIYEPSFSPGELKRKSNLMSGVGDIFGMYGAFGLLALRFARSKPGEFVAMLHPDGKLWTRHFPPTATATAGHHDIVSDASQFYLDQTGESLIHSGYRYLLRAGHYPLPEGQSKK